MIRIARQVADEFDAIMPKTTANAVTMRSRDGLKISTTTKAQNDMWSFELSKAIPSLVGTTFDYDLYQQINRILERSRSGQ
jgi:hypothetical protein